MKRFEQGIELDENWQPAIGKAADILKSVLPYFAASSTYLLFLNIGLWFAFSLERLPIVNVLGYVLGFFAAAIGWLVALLFCLFGGKLEFANEVFLMIRQEDFRISILSLLISFFLARIVGGVLRKAEIPHSKNLKLLYGTLAISFIGLALFFSFTDKMDEPIKYYFMYSMLGIVYLLFAGKYERKDESRKSGIKESKDLKQNEDYSWDELRKIFQDLVN